jgi:xanthine dehydrogenase accessory factor
MRRAILEEVLKAKSAGVPEIGELALDSASLAEARRLLAADLSLTIGGGEGRIFLQVLSPPPRLIIVGAVHIAEPLARMAESAGYSVIVIDPRRAFARREQFRGFTVVDDWPDEALARLQPDERTAVVTLTHDPKLDDPALLIALRSRAFYIGCLGSRKTHGARLARLRAAGATAEQIDRIHGPVGLPIGARTPAEIAISILAELTRVRRGAGER